MNLQELTSPEHSIEFREVFFSIHGHATRKIISGVSLLVPHGETLVLLGRSGGGKTRFPQLRATLGELSGKVSESDIRKLNYAVDALHQDPATVVREFRLSNGL